MKKMKTVMGLLAALSVLASAFTAVYAIEGGTNISSDSPVGENLKPRVCEVCGGLPYHKLVSAAIRGTVYLEDGTQYIVGGAVWQCENCDLVMITEGDIIFNEMQTIEKWTYASDMGGSSNIPYVMYIPEAYGVCNSNTMDGYRFFLDPLF